MTTSIYPLGFAYSYPLVHRSRTDLLTIARSSTLLDARSRMPAAPGVALVDRERSTVADGIMGCPIMVAHLRNPRPFFKAIGLARGCH